MNPDIAASITQAAQEAGIDPSFALAVADRESSGDPNAHASKSIYGLFQMSGPLRQQYGSGDSSDPYTQAKAWTSFIGDMKNNMAQRLGRQPTNAELYLGHYFGEGRASRMISGQTPAGANASDVFTPTELALNPELARQGSSGNIIGSITGDITRREAKFGGEVPQGTSMYIGSNGEPDFTKFGTAQDNSSAPSAQAIDFTKFGTAEDGMSPGHDGTSAGDIGRDKPG